MSLLYNFPTFSDLKLDQIETSLDEIMTDSRLQIENLASVENPNWENLIYPLDVLSDKLSRFFSPLRHLNSVLNSEEVRAVYNACLPKMSAYYTDLGQHIKLFEKIMEFSKSEQYGSLDTAQKKCIDDLIQSFTLGGVALIGGQRERFKEVALRMSELRSKFQENILDCTNAWRKHFTTQERLAGLPQNTLDLAAQAAKRDGLEGYIITLEFPSYYAVMTFADDRALREEIYTAYMTRAADTGPHEARFDNSALIEEIIALRSEKSELLGFSSYADYSVATKMVDSPAQVEDFLHDLSTVAKPIAQKEVTQLREIASREHGLENLQSWDISYYSNRLKKQLFDFSEEDLKPYFPADQAIPGMFSVCGKLFGLTISEIKNADVWHEDVKLYEIVDSTGNQRGAFYLDTYARPNKRGGAWMDVCVSRMALGQNTQLPVAYLTCNATPPIGDAPALLTHAEVSTLFHEFGHGLHHMLTQVDYLQISGIAGVEWDAVELPSQFLENWCWERESLDMISGHFESGNKIPAELLEKARAARNFQSAMMTVRQIEFGLFDMQLHQRNDTPDATEVNSILNKIRQEVAVNPVPEFVRFQNGFSHIFAGGYAAGYFSYKWAEVLSCDAFSRFEEEGIFNHQTGSEFMQCILERGGSQKAMELFVAFRGREPVVDALLRHSGLAA